MLPKNHAMRGLPVYDLVIWYIFFTSQTLLQQYIFTRIHQNIMKIFLNFLNCNFQFLLLIAIFSSDKVETAYWTEEQYELFEDILLNLVDQHFDNNTRRFRFQSSI